MHHTAELATVEHADGLRGSYRRNQLLYYLTNGKGVKDEALLAFDRSRRTGGERRFRAKGSKLSPSRNPTASLS